MLCVTLETQQDNKAAAWQVEPVFMFLLLANNNRLLFFSINFPVHSLLHFAMGSWMKDSGADLKFESYTNLGAVDFFFIQTQPIAF